MILIGLGVLTGTYIISELIHKQGKKLKKIKRGKKRQQTLLPQYALEPKIQLQLSILFTILVPVAVFYRALFSIVLVGLSIVSVPLIRQAQINLIEKKNVDHHTLNALITIITMVTGKYFFVGLNALLYHLGDSVIFNTKRVIVKTQSHYQTMIYNDNQSIKPKITAVPNIEEIIIGPIPLQYQKDTDSRWLLIFAALSAPILGKKAAANILTVYPYAELQAFPALHLAHYLESLIKEDIVITDLNKIHLLAKVDTLVFSANSVEDALKMKNIFQQIKNDTYIKDIFVFIQGRVSDAAILEKIQLYQNRGHTVAWVEATSALSNRLMREYVDLYITNDSSQMNIADIIFMKGSWKNLPYLFKNTALLQRSIIKSLLICSGYSVTNMAGTLIWRFGITTGLSLDAVQWAIALKHAHDAKQKFIWYKK